jgi:hypothetical protein
VSPSTAMKSNMARVQKLPEESGIAIAGAVS